MTDAHDVPRPRRRRSSGWRQTVPRQPHRPTAVSESRGGLSPSKALALDLPRFYDLIDETLPIVNVGCGKGLWTAALASHFAYVIGTDATASTVTLARECSVHPNASFEVLDPMDLASVQRFHARHGDVNLYLRFVLSHVPSDEREQFAESVETLVGERGTLYLHEPSAHAEPYARTCVGHRAMPATLTRASSVHGTLLRGLFPDNVYEYLREGDSLTEGHVDDRSEEPSVNCASGGSVIPRQPSTYFAVLRARMRR